MLLRATKALLHGTILLHVAQTYDMLCSYVANSFVCRANLRILFLPHTTSLQLYGTQSLVRNGGLRACCAVKVVLVDFWADTQKCMPPQQHAERKGFC